MRAMGQVFVSLILVVCCGGAAWSSPIGDPRSSIQQSYNRSDQALARQDINGILAVVALPSSSRAVQSMREKLHNLFASGVTIKQSTAITRFRLSKGRAVVRIHQHVTVLSPNGSELPNADPERLAEDIWVLQGSNWKRLSSRSVQTVALSVKKKTPRQITRKNR